MQICNNLIDKKGLQSTLVGWKKEESTALEDLELLTCEDLANDSMSETNKPSGDHKQREKSKANLVVTKLSK